MHGDARSLVILISLEATGTAFVIAVVKYVVTQDSCISRPAKYSISVQLIMTKINNVREEPSESTSNATFSTSNPAIRAPYVQLLLLAPLHLKREHQIKPK